MTLGNHHPDESASADKGSAAAEETAPVLPEANYEGYEVRVLNNISNFAYTNIGEEGLTGESLDDEVYNRNKIVEEELNITFAIEKKEVGETKAIIQELVLADDDAYDFYTCDLNIVMSHAMNGCDVNVVNIDTLELDQLWWNKPATDSISIGDSVYAFFGDLHTGYFESHNIVAFNKEMITNLGLSPPCEHAYEGTWTLDVFIDMINKAKSDTNGDGEWTVDDRYGFTMVEGNWSLSYIIGCKQFIMQKDENNLPVWNGLSEQYYDVYSKVAANIFSSTTNNASNALGTLTSSGSRDQTQQMFFNSNALFLVTLVGVLKNMRDAEFEVGVVPAPKYDETQQNYVSMIFQGANAFAIPVTNSDPERTGMVLNYLAARSTDTVRKTYIEQTLGFKYISDKEGQNMMDIILSTGIFDLASVHGWGNIAGTIMGNLRSGTLEISSSIASAESLLQRTMKDTIETFAEVGE